VTITEQLALNPPVRDDLDIQRSGLRAYMTTVACATKDQVGHAPNAWISLTADRPHRQPVHAQRHRVGSLGIVSPICEGDNLEWDGVVYHIESVTHSASCSTRRPQDLLDDADADQRHAR
jgi:hypothetical protein